MEVSATVLEGVSLVGDATHVPDAGFTAFITKACEGILLPKCKDSLSDDATFKSCNQGILKEAYGCLVTLILEAAKNDADPSTLGALLEDCKFTSDRISKFNEIFTKQKPHLQLVLGSIGGSYPHIVDVDWRLDYSIKSNNLDKINEPVYLVVLKTEVAGSSELEEVQFSCTLNQLQDLVGKLKDATKCLERASQM